MPHVSSGGGGDDLGSTDEVKVFKDEGEDEKRSSENLTEEKSSLIDLTESEEKVVSGQTYSSSKNVSRSDLSPVFGKVEPTPHTSSFNMGYLVSPYPYHNGTAGPIPVSMSSVVDQTVKLPVTNDFASKMGLGPGHPGAGLPFFCHNGEHLTQPPPAHMGIPPYQLDPKGAGEYWRTPVPPFTHTEWKRLGPLLAATGLTRAPMYPFTTGQYPYPMLSPEMSQVAASWHTPSMYPISSASAGFRSPYPTSLPISSSSLTSDLYRFSPSGLMAPHPGLSPHSHPSLASHPAIVTPGPKQDLSQAPDHNHRSSSMDRKNSSSAANEGSKSQDSGHASNNQEKKPHIKKPLNAFMLYMKEMRAKVVAECTLKESAAINQILGRRWHSLTREEQAKYYEKARQERQLHMELYPGWSARDNYGYGAKKKKRKKERVPIADTGGNNMKKCRARYGLDQQSQWCKPCRRKKKCIRYMECGEDGNQSEDNLGSCGSVGEAQTPPEDDSESFHHSMSSPGGLSGLSSLTSPSMILPSPSASLASPSVSLASPCMSLQSPLTPHALDFAECNSTNSNKPPPPPPCLPLLINHHLAVVQPHRNPVGTNPHDINNPLSVNQLTGKCIKNSSSSPGSSSATSSGKESTSRPVISVP
ncbi:transcription factor pangolin [Lycorma delicatula]|uniref:transcription factor pangolin n=1 Tax=Lycorma delicatula TaxID=130591 RepID=UPI003F51400E